ncbi:MAG: hypothetical protein IT548_02480 [Alphaproteobacteria bacterium]|nr:hypothetical protein [Alphaproteobacteria bacterium]
MTSAVPENAAQHEQIKDSTARSFARLLDTPQGDYIARKIEVAIIAGFIGICAFFLGTQWDAPKWQSRLDAKDAQIAEAVVEIGRLQHALEINRQTTKENRCFGVAILSLLSDGKWVVPDRCWVVIDEWIAGMSTSDPPRS